MRFRCRGFRSLIVNQSPMFKGWDLCRPCALNAGLAGSAEVMEHLKDALAFALDIEWASE
jgi:hypothetical protein